MIDKFMPPLPTFVPGNLEHRGQKITHSLQSVKRFEADGDDSRLRKACTEMESLFLTHLLKEMRDTIEKSGFISGGRAEEIFTSLLDVEFSKKMSAAGGIGLSNIIMQQLGGKLLGKAEPES